MRLANTTAIRNEIILNVALTFSRLEHFRRVLAKRKNRVQIKRNLTPLQRIIVRLSSGERRTIMASSESIII